MCALILLATISGMAAVRIELEIFREVSRLPQPITKKDEICYATKDTKCAFYVQVSNTETKVATLYRETNWMIALFFFFFDNCHLLFSMKYWSLSLKIEDIIK
jgi:hypothetical protein